LSTRQAPRVGSAPVNRVSEKTRRVRDMGRDEGETERG
jgi:hypothetical protein